MLFFVYGTLRRGQGASRMLGNSSFEGEDSVIDHELWNLGSYPGMVPGRGQVFGDVFDVTSMRVAATLDEFEGVPHLYKRKKISLKGGDDAYAYIFAQNILPGRHLRIQSGNWLKKDG
jgi:gamma-glutamylcyclotransferase (GGCT)/AIG2-like uncharacterized protein YtfP